MRSRRESKGLDSQPPGFVSSVLASSPAKSALGTSLVSRALSRLGLLSYAMQQRCERCGGRGPVAKIIAGARATDWLCILCRSDVRAELRRTGLWRFRMVGSFERTPSR